MSNKVKIKMDINLIKLKELQKNIKDEHYTKVGILAGKAQEQEPNSKMTMVEMGLIQEFGSLTRRIPARSFLLMPLQTKNKEIIDFLNKHQQEFEDMIARGDIKQIYEMLGVEAQKIIQEAFETKGFGQWAPNSPKTIAKKGSDMPLIDTGHLRRTIEHKVVSK